MSADETMAEVMAGVAIAEARRTGLMQVVEHTGAAWHLYSQGAGPLCGEGTLVVVRPREDVVGVAKRILGARLSGLTVPQAVLALVGAERKPEPKPERPAKAAIAATMSPPKPPPEPAPAVKPRPGPVPHQLKPPATIQTEMF